ncbi:MAG: DNA-processing protein DprA, partial [Frankiaceae bacterium]
GVTGVAPVCRQERLARAGLTRLAEPGDRAVRRCVLAEGPVAAYERLRAQRPDLPDPASDLRRMDALGGRFLCPGDDEWPAQLADLERAWKTGPDGWAGEPFGLWVRGPARLSSAAHLSVAVVGSRSATAYGVAVAGRLAADLADRGWWVVSGAAVGIDTAAHEAALDCERTFAVLANGVDVAYPPENARMLRRISSCGLLVSEVPCGVTPRRPRFLVRNRLLAALSLGTVVVEAGLRSGALNTARHAAGLGRPVLGVPGPVTSVLSAGVHQLLREQPQARLVTREAEIIEEVGRIGELADPLPGPGSPRDGLSAVLLAVLDAVPARRWALAATIAESARLEAPTVRSVLVALERHGLVEASAGTYRLTPLGRAPSNVLAQQRPARLCE